jgi:hypothetical protein
MAKSISPQAALDFLGAISKEEARKAGKTRYVATEPCKYGHVAERWVSDDACVECHLLHRKQRYQRDPQNFAANSRKWRSSEKGKAYSLAYNRKWAQANPKNVIVNRERAKLRHQARMKDDPAYAEKYREANRIKNAEAKRKRDLRRAGELPPDRCEICGKASKEICFDHCHQTGRFRGWLCHQCNHVLGLANDSPDLLRRMAQYLEKQIVAS